MWYQSKAKESDKKVITVLPSHWPCITFSGVPPYQLKAFLLLLLQGLWTEMTTCRSMASSLLPLG